MKTGALLALLSLAACSVPVQPEVGTSQDPVLRGVPSGADQDAVVRLEIRHDEGPFMELCSGTLIAPDRVLTARHCLAVRDRTKPRPACRATVDGVPSDHVETPDFTYIGDVPAAAVNVIATRTLGTSAGTNAPTATGSLPSPTFGDGAVAAVGARIVDDGASEMCGHDVAVVVLDRPIANARIAPVRTTPPEVGEALVAVGWGRTEDGFPSERRSRAGVAVLANGETVYRYRRQSGTEIPMTLLAGELGTGEAMCVGDSGGPLLDARGAVVGVVSRVPPGGSVRCVDTPVVYSFAGHWTHLTR